MEENLPLLFNNAISDAISRDLCLNLLCVLPFLTPTSIPLPADPQHVQENPYVMRKDNYQDFQGNDQYEGFCVDMLRELADILKFSFKIKLVDDGLYGAPEPNGSWTGMVGELINRVSTFLLAAGRTKKVYNKSWNKTNPQKSIDGK